VTSLLRGVEDADLPVLFENQRDPEALRLVAYVTRERDAFDAHWRRIRADSTTYLRTIVSEGAVAGHVASFDRSGRREVGYWLRRALWGRGLATAALAEFLRDVEHARPLYGMVVPHNAASQRVLAKCGFSRAGEVTEGAQPLVAYVLMAPPR